MNFNGKFKVIFKNKTIELNDFEAYVLYPKNPVINEKAKYDLTLNFDCDVDIFEKLMNMIYKSIINNDTVLLYYQKLISLNCSELMDKDSIFSVPKMQHFIKTGTCLNMQEYLHFTCKNRNILDKLFY